MEFIILTFGYFALLGCMVYKGADVPSILGAAGLYVSAYLGVRKNSHVTQPKTKSHDNDRRGS